MLLKGLFREKIVGLFFFVLSLIFVCGSIFLVSNFVFFLYQPATREIHQKEVKVTPGMNLKEIANVLKENQIISNAFLFKWFVHWKRMDAKLKAGEYHFTTFLAPTDVLFKLQKGEEKLQRITVPEGYTVRQIAKLMEENKLGKYQQIMRLSKDKNFIEEQGLNASSLEGYLFPNTYFFSKSQNAADLLKMMVEEFKKHFNKIWEKRLNDNALSQYETVILASMVEKEALVDDERPLIAGVFLNRLKKGMLLQCDPTVIYGLKYFDGNLRKRDLMESTPYNTYTNKGLPPGPICNPGLSSLKAAARPARVPYLYFVSQNNGHHFFSVTLAEHNKAVRRFQIKRKTKKHH